MNTMKEDIYNTLLSAGRAMTVSEIMKQRALTNQPYISKLLRELRNEERVASFKNGRNIYYYTSDQAIGLEKDLRLVGLAEDSVWRDFLNNDELFNKSLNEKARDILSFAFSEMLNNAIDHSMSEVGYVKIWREGQVVKFIVKDEGVGIFRNFMTEKHLDDEIMAIQELIKGKQTTDPKRHSGEGIFWTSKIADKMTISSFGYSLIINNEIEDYTIRQLEEQIVGTEIYFEIDANTTKSLQTLFARYSSDRETYNLDTTEILIKLFESGEVWISRSQAKRVMSGLERYKRIILNFKGIELIGQGFADEIFRVFEISHPEIKIVPTNMEKSVEIMVNRAKSDPTGR